jgi:hypothetical protein
MKRHSAVPTILVLAVAVGAHARESRFFPKSIDPNGRHGMMVHCYSNQLQGMNEPSLFDMRTTGAVQSYRFLWLRALTHPIAVRVDIEPDGTGVLTTKMGSGSSCGVPGTLIQNSSRKLDDTQVDAFLALVRKSGFWTAPSPANDQTGTDGAEWIIEGLKAGKYHVIDRWSPGKGPAHDLGIFLAFDLAKMDIPTNEIY